VWVAAEMSEDLYDRIEAVKQHHGLKNDVPFFAVPCPVDLAAGNGKDRSNRQPGGSKRKIARAVSDRGRGLLTSPCPALNLSRLCGCARQRNALYREMVVSVAPLHLVPPLRVVGEATVVRQDCCVDW
jgi:hypothetical protein